MNLRSQDLDLVRCIAESGSLTAAARLLHISQSAVSQRLGNLQDRAGVRFFERVDGRMQLTRAGERANAAAARVAAELRSAEQDIDALSSARAQQLRITTECYTCYRWLPFVVRNMRERFPQLAVDVVPEATDTPCEALLADRIDVALVSNPLADSRLGEKDLFADEMMAVMSDEHPLANFDFLDARQFSEQTLILYTGKRHAVVDKVLAPAGVQAGEIIQVRITEAIIELARAGQGIAVIAAWAFDDFPDRDGLTAIRISEQGFVRNWRAAINPRARQEYVDAFVDCVGSIGRDIRTPSWRQHLGTEKRSRMG